MRQMVRVQWLPHMTQDEKFSVWTLQDFTAELHWRKVFSKIDLLKGYHQVPLAEEENAICVHIDKCLLFEWRRPSAKFFALK